MRKTSLLLLSGAFLFLLILTILIFNQNLYKSEKESLLLYPNFAKSLEKISKVSIYYKGKKYDLIKNNNIWTLSNYKFYPADVKKINNFFIQISQLDLVDRKTNNPKNHQSLGLSNNTKENNDNKIVEILDSQNNKLYEFIVGIKAKHSIDKSARYIRKANENQVWLFTQPLEIYDDEISWSNRSLLKLGRWRVQSLKSIDAEYKKNNYLISRKNYDSQMFELEDIPKKYSLTDIYITNSIVSTMEGIEVMDILKKDEISNFKLKKVIEVKTFDGLVLLINVLSLAKDKVITLDINSNLSIRKELDKDGPKVIGIPNMKDFEEIEKEVKDYSFLKEWAFRIDDISISNLLYNKPSLIKKND